MKKRIHFFEILILFLATVLPIQAFEIPASTDAYYLDEASVLSTDLENYITEKNSQLDDYCGSYIEVITEKYINCDVADYTYRIQNEWEISDNGFTLVLVTEEEKYYLMWGREIEKKIEPYVFQNILDQYFESDFDKGNYERAVRKVYDAIYKEIVKVYGMPSTTYTRPKSNFYSIGRIIGLLLVILVWLCIVRLVMRILRGGIGFFPGRYTRYRSNYRTNTHRTSSRSTPGRSSSRSRSHGGGGRGSGVGRR